MSDKKRIIEQLKKEYQKSHGGLGGLSYSASPMAHDKMFEKQAEQIIKSQQSRYQPQVPSVPHIDMEKVKAEARKIEAQKRERDAWEKQRIPEYRKQCISEISVYRDAMIRFSKEGNVKAVEKWFKDGFERIKEQYLSSDLKYKWMVRVALEFALRKELGVAYISMGKLTKAKKPYLDMLKVLSEYRDPLEKYSINYGEIWGWPITFDSIAYLFMSIDDYNMTEKLFKEALKNDYRASQNMKALREVFLGEALLAKGNIKKANKNFEHAKILTSQNTVLAKHINRIIDNAKKKI